MFLQRTEDVMFGPELLKYDLVQMCDGERDRLQHLMDLLMRYKIPYRLRPYEDCPTVNLIVEFGDNPSRWVIGAHYDIVPPSPGANDNAVACLALVELARRLKNATFGGNLTIVWFDGEENLAGMGPYEEMGSVCLINDWRAQGLEPEGVLVLDVIGVGDTPFISEYGTLGHDPRVLEHLTETTKSIPPSDNLAFMEAGWPVWLLCTAFAPAISGGYPPVYHRFHPEMDTPDQEGMNLPLVVEIINRVERLVWAWNGVGPAEHIEVNLVLDGSR
jgi:hypothetical protein